MAELLRDPGFETSTALSTATRTYTNPYSAQTKVTVAHALSTANPLAGSKHYRGTEGSSPTFSAADISVWPETTPDPGLSEIFPVAHTASPGNEYTASAQFSFVSQTNLTDIFAQVSLWFFDADGTAFSNSSTSDYDLADVGAGYQPISHSFTAPANSAWVGATYIIQMFSDNSSTVSFVMDIDATSLTVPDAGLSLFVTPTGFRFPYQRWT